MKRINLLQALAMTISSAGVLLPQAVIAQTPVMSQAKFAAVVTDVSLGDGGFLCGQVVDTEGQAVAGAEISILHEGKTVASTVTDSNGSFAVGGLRGGLHVVALGDEGGVCRTWSPNSAPPSANQSLMIVRGGTFARGGDTPVFSGFGGKGLLMMGLLGGIIAAGLISQDRTHGSGS